LRFSGSRVLTGIRERTVQDNKDRIYVSKASNKYEAQIREWEVNNKHSNLNAADNEKLGKLEVLSDLA
jgi:molybdopterin converting factor small subunit